MEGNVAVAVYNAAFCQQQLILCLFPCHFPPEMGPLIADLIVLLQKNRQACFTKDTYREPKVDELLPWERENRNQQQKKTDKSDEQDKSASPMAISKTP